MDYRYFNSLTKQQKFLLKGMYPLNWVFGKFNLKIEIVPRTDNNHMISLEQRINLFHLLNGVLIQNVEGDVVELGCHIGNTAMQIQSILSNYNSKKTFHVYDKFEAWPGLNGSVIDLFKQNFIISNLDFPEIHLGDFRETIPRELPDQLAFIHIDIGNAEDAIVHKNLLLFLLEHIYHRMPHNAVCLIMDYHDINLTVKGDNSLPGIKDACDSFFKNKSEKMNVLYGNHFSHGYFRKLS
jgi:O-methyltransferase